MQGAPYAPYNPYFKNICVHFSKFNIKYLSNKDKLVGLLKKVGALGALNTMGAMAPQRNLVVLNYIKSHFKSIFMKVNKTISI